MPTITTDGSFGQVGAGAEAGTGVMASEEGGGPFHFTTLTLTNVTIALVDNAGVDAHGGLKVYDFPAGVIRILGAVLATALTKSSAGVDASFDGDVGVGSVVVAAGATLATTEQDIIPTTATPQAVAGVTTANGKSTTTEGAAVFDGTSTSLDLYINLLVDDADHDVTGTPCNLILNGTLKIAWINLGDY